LRIPAKIGMLGGLRPSRTNAFWGMLVRVGAAYLDGAQAYDGEARQLATHLLALYFPPWVPQ
jgi:hypothetical protein